LPEQARLDGLGEAPGEPDNRTVIRIAQRTSKRRQQAADLAFWLARPMAERMAAAEALRV
jgi:hypothetical protein